MGDDLRLRPRGLGETGSGGFTPGVKALQAVDDLAALTALLANERDKGSGVVVISAEDTFFFYPLSTATVDGVQVLAPDDITPPTAGRWLREIEKAVGSGVATLDANSAVVQPIVKVKESGATVLPVGAIGDGQILKRVGTDIVGVAASSGLNTPRIHDFNGNGVLVTFTLPVSIPAGLLDACHVFRNGMRLKKVAAAPADLDEYTISGDTLTFGGAPAVTDDLHVDYWT